MQPSNKQLREYERWGVEPPSQVLHDITPEELLKKLIPTKATSWRLEGNELVAETNHGVLRQKIPTDYICHGIDKNCLPILKKIGTTIDSAADRGAK